MSAHLARPLYWRVADDIIAKIESGVWHLGDKLPSEHVLCERYNVSQITVRRALRELAHAGRVYSRHGLGWYVGEGETPSASGRQVVLAASAFDGLMAVIAPQLASRLGARGLGLHLAYSSDEGSATANAVSQALTEGAQALVLAVEGREHNLAQRYGAILAQSRAPAMLLLRDVAELDAPAAVLDESACMAELTRYVLGLGHTRVAYVGSDPSTVDGWRRYHGFADTLWSGGLELPLDWVFAAPLAGAERERFERAFEGGLGPSAIVASSDERAAETMFALRRLRLRCPEDVAVVGLGDSPFAPYLPSPLTTFRPNLAALAQNTAAMAVDLADGRAVHSVRVTGNLVVRASCGAELANGRGAGRVGSAARAGVHG